MQLRATAAVVIAGLSLLGPARAAAPPNWALVLVTAGNDGSSDVEVTVYATGARTSGPGITGVGTGSTSDGPSDFDFAHQGGGTTDLTTTNGAGSLEVHAPGANDGATTFWLSFTAAWPHLDAGASAAILLIANGFSIDTLDLNPPRDDGSTSITIEKGSDATVLVTDPADAGTAISAGPVLGGMFTHGAHVANGVAGGFTDIEFCDFCTESWHAPDGASGMSQYSPIASDPRGNAFAGPSGEWSWTWLGVGDARFYLRPRSQAVYAAYAPVGDAWRLFR